MTTATATEEQKIVKRDVGERVDILCSFDSALTKDLGNGTFEATITTSAIDRQGENILTDGIDTSNWIEKNPVVLWGHDYSGLPIGKGLSVKPYKNKITARFQLAVEEYPFAATVAEMIKGGYINATSIGGIVRKWSDDYRTILELEMVEFSIVPVPANADAIIMGRSLEDATGKTLETIKGEFADFSQRIFVDKFKHMGDDESTEAIKVLKNLTAHLEEAAKAEALGDEEEPAVKKIRKFVLKEKARAVVTQSQKVNKIIKLKF